MPTTDDSTRRVAFLILLMTALGACLRLWGAHRLGLSHFDEGIYARAGTWPFLPGGFPSVGPGVMAYAPPVYPLLIGVASLPVGPSDFAAIGVSLTCGILTIPVVGWLGWRTFGPEAGMASAGIATLSGAHVVFSRMALTDAPFLLIWLLTLGLGARFLERPGLARAIVFGAAVGLAQATKYSGWIAGAIVAASACLVLLNDRRQGVRALGFGIISAASAAIVYAPWFLFVEANGGYDRLLAHQRSYLGGSAAWWPHWKLQMAQSLALSRGEMWFSHGIALALIGLTACGYGRGTDSRRQLRFPTWSWLFAVPIGLMTTDGFLWLACLGWSSTLLMDVRPARKVLGVWWLVLAVLTPFYHPYARLWLPIQAAGWVAGGGLLLCVVDPENAGSCPGRRRIVSIPILVSVALGFAWTVARFPVGRTLDGTLGPTDALRTFVEKDVFPRSSSKGRAVIRTYVSPALSFYLADHATVLAQDGPIGAIPSPDSDAWGMIDESLIPDEAARRSLRGRLGRAERFEIPYSPATLLDIDPRNANARPPHEGRVVWLFRPRSAHP